MAKFLSDFGRMEPRVRRKVVDSSPPPEDDNYEFGSFVIADDAEVSYLTQVDDSLSSPLE